MSMNLLIAEWLRDPTAAARRHHQQGGRVIGYAGPEIPVELIIAAGAMPMRVTERPDLNTNTASRYLEQSFMPSSFSLVEQYLQGSLDHLDALILPRSNDSLQRVYYYLCELQRRGACRGPQVLIYDLAKIDRATSARHAVQATEKLAIVLGSDMSRLPEAITARNERRGLLAAAKQQRQHGASAAELQVIAQLADLAEPAAFNAALRTWLEQVPKTPRVPVLLAGSAPPDARLHQAIEAAGGNVVAELGEAAANLVDTQPIAADAGLAGISAHYRHYTASGRAFVDRAELLQQLIRDHQPAQVIHWLIEQDETLVWDLPREVRVVTGNALPSLTLTRRAWRADDGALDEMTRFVAQGRNAA